MCLISNSSMTTGARALGARAPVVCQAAAWVGASAPGGHDTVAPVGTALPRPMGTTQSRPRCWRRRGRSDDANHR
ncbi:hypothetical protein GFL77_22045 [Rhizobium leguminosarum bv. viciae]|nr:hypothetical protein [Rhizobium leguminosarum bv. viciae]